MLKTNRTWPDTRDGSLLRALREAPGAVEAWSRRGELALLVERFDAMVFRWPLHRVVAELQAVRALLPDLEEVEPEGPPVPEEPRRRRKKRSERPINWED